MVPNYIVVHSLWLGAWCVCRENEGGGMFVFFWRMWRLVAALPASKEHRLLWSAMLEQSCVFLSGFPHEATGGERCRGGLGRLFFLTG